MSFQSGMDSNMASWTPQCDIVAAITQQSADTTIKNFFAFNPGPVTDIYFVADSSGNAQLATVADIQTILGNNTDLFSIVHGTAVSNDKNLEALSTGKFLVGFRAALGLPPIHTWASLPPMVELGVQPDCWTNFTFLFQTFIVVSFVTDPSGEQVWSNETQDPNNPWAITSETNLLMGTTFFNRTQWWQNLPSAVQSQVKNLSDSAYSVQQFVFDCATMGLFVPPVSGLAGGTIYPHSTGLISQYFIGKYLPSLVANTTNQALLNYPAPDQSTPTTSSLALTDLSIASMAFMKNWNGTTLHYIGNVNNDPLTGLMVEVSETPHIWIKEAEIATVPGLIAISRKAFATYWQNKLTTYVTSLCVLPQPKCTPYFSAGSPDGGQPDYHWSFAGNQTPTVTLPTSGNIVLQFDYHQDITSSYSEWPSGSFEIIWTTKVTLTVQDNEITFDQYITVTVHTGDGEASGDLTNQHLSQAVAFDVTDLGALLVTSSTPTFVDNGSPNLNGSASGWSNPDGTPPLITQFSSDALTGHVGNATTIESFITSTINSFQFPGTNDFVFWNVRFANSQDLIVYIGAVESSFSMDADAPKIARQWTNTRAF